MRRRIFGQNKVRARLMMFVELQATWRMMKLIFLSILNDCVFLFWKWKYGKIVSHLFSVKNLKQKPLENVKQIWNEVCCNIILFGLKFRLKIFLCKRKKERTTARCLEILQQRFIEFSHIKRLNREQSIKELIYMYKWNNNSSSDGISSYSNVLMIFRTFEWLSLKH